MPCKTLHSLVPVHLPDGIFTTLPLGCYNHTDLLTIPKHTVLLGLRLGCTSCHNAHSRALHSCACSASSRLRAVSPPLGRSLWPSFLSFLRGNISSSVFPFHSFHLGIMSHIYNSYPPPRLKNLWEGTLFLVSLSLAHDLIHNLRLYCKLQYYLS